MNEMNRRFAVGVLLLGIVSTPALAQQPSAAGRIKVASGAVFVVRGETTLSVEAGQVVYEGDVLRTGPNGRTGVTLEDNTRVSLGPASELRIDRFVYAPAEGRIALVLKMVRGIAAYVSGRIAKLSPDAVRLETPAAIVGVRGTTVALRVMAK